MRLSRRVDQLVDQLIDRDPDAVLEEMFPGICKLLDSMEDHERAEFLKKCIETLEDR